MTASALDPSADFASDAAIAARAARRIEVVQRLTEMGIELAEALHRQGLARIERAVEDPEAPAVDGGAAELKFSRLTKAVRMCLALGARLDQDLLAQGPKAEAARVARLVEEGRERKVARRRAIQRKFQVQEIVEQAIVATVDQDDVEDFNDRLSERLDDDDDAEAADFANLPIGVMVARVCRDLGVTPYWNLWKDEAWAIEEAATLPPGSPYTLLAALAASGAPPDAPLEDDDEDDDQSEDPPPPSNGDAGPEWPPP